jgi:hypothetical protein
MAAEREEIVEITPEEEERSAPRREVLDRIVDEVARDARDRPEAYLEETEVPAGGE